MVINRVRGHIIILSNEVGLRIKMLKIGIATVVESTRTQCQIGLVRDHDVKLTLKGHATILDKNIGTLQI